MAKQLASSSHSLLLLIVFFISVAVVVQFAKEADAAMACQTDLGICSQSCQQRCNLFFKDGQGQCDPSSGHCKCTFTCDVPEPRLCNGSGGLCSLKCRDNCCSANCAAKYGNGIGFCDNTLPETSLCQCQYTC